MNHQDFIDLSPILQAEALDVQMSGPDGGSLIVIDDLQSGLIVNVDFCGSFLWMPQILQDTPKEFGCLGSITSSNEVSLCGAASSEGLSL